MKTILFTYTTVLNVVILISLLFAIKNFKKIRLTNLGIFPLYTFISLLVDIISYIDKPCGILLTNMFIIFEFVIFYNFYWKILNDSKSHKILTLIFISFIFLFIIMIPMYYYRFKYIFNDNLSFIEIFIKHPFMELMAATDILIIIPVILYFRSLFLIPINKLNADPIFLVMTGIIFGFCIMIPMDAMFLLVRSYAKNLFMYLYVINAFGYILFHLFLIKAYSTFQ